MDTLHIDGLGHDLRVVRFAGHEAISELFQFEIIVVCKDDELTFGSVVGKHATLAFPSDETPRKVSGIVASLTRGDDGKQHNAYLITLVPTVWRLEHRRDSRIFQALSTPEIVSKVLQKAGVDASAFRLSLSASYAPREYCVQYRETDWTFICRLLEEEGIHYFFEHGESGEVVVFADGAAAHVPIPGGAEVVFRSASCALLSSEHVSSFRTNERIRPGKVTLRDYNFKKPSVSLTGSSAASADTDLEVYDYPGEYETPEVATSTAKIRLEQLQATKTTGEGESVCSRLVPGYVFNLVEHAWDDFNGEYLITRIDHEGSEPGIDSQAGDDTASYRNRFEVTPSKVPYRPAQITPRPTIRGIQTAIVVGPQGEEIHTDEHGRIKVQFHWDREGKRDETSSCWIRVSQIWAGPAWGSIFIPRVGHEVVIDFLEGDPDRPLVVGSVYHGANVPPYGLPAEKTKSTMMSRSSIGGDGFNELRFEDKKGKEEVFVHAEKDLALVVKHDRTADIDHDNTETVGGDESVTVTGNRTLSVGIDQSATIDGKESLSVGKSRTVEIGESMSLAVGKGKTETVGGASSETVSKGKTSKVDETYALTVGKDMSISVSKNFKEDIQGEKTMIVGKKLSVQCGDATIVIEKNGDITIQGKKIVVKGDGAIEVQGKKLQVKCDGAVNVEASGNVVIKGSNVGVN